MTDPHKVANSLTEAQKECATCKFENSYHHIWCRFPEAQDGSGNPFVVTAAMPSPESNGANCTQWVKRGDILEEQNHEH